MGSSTVQITLNSDSEYVGGRLCFYAPDKGITIPDRRRAGTMTIHDDFQMHAVTRLVSGTRYSLFVVDRGNGLGDKGSVFVVGRAQFDAVAGLGEAVEQAKKRPRTK